MTAKETAKELVQKVKALFNAPIAPIVTELAPVDPAAPAAPAPEVQVSYKLQDGTEISVLQEEGEAPDMGDVVSQNGAPVTAGDYTLENGSTLVVGDGGVISEVKPVAPVTVDPAAMPPVPSFEERIAKLEEALTRLSQPAPVQYATEEEIGRVKSKLEKQDKVIEGLFEIAEKLSETPTAEPETLNGNKKAKFDKRQTKENKLDGIAAAITQLKNK